MSLPFLKPKKMTSTILIGKIKDSGESEIAPEAEMDPVLMSIAEGLISAVHAKDAKAVVESLQEAFKVMDAEPHVEGEHV